MLSVAAKVFFFSRSRSECRVHGCQRENWPLAARTRNQVFRQSRDVKNHHHHLQHLSRRLNFLSAFLLSAGSPSSHRPVLQESLSVLPVLAQQEPEQQRLRLQQGERDGHQVSESFSSSNGFLWHAVQIPLCDTQYKFLTSNLHLISPPWPFHHNSSLFCKLAALVRHRISLFGELITAIFFAANVKKDACGVEQCTLSPSALATITTGFSLKTLTRNLNNFTLLIPGTFVQMFWSSRSSGSEARVRLTVCTSLHCSNRIFVLL